MDDVKLGKNHHPLYPGSISADRNFCICGDETTDGQRGKNVYRKARHRDAIHSSHSHTVCRYGHEWIVLTMLVVLPYRDRPLVLPVLEALYRANKTNQREGRRHKTAVELIC
jgi:hypothetical protein